MAQPSAALNLTTYRSAVSDLTRRIGAGRWLDPEQVGSVVEMRLHAPEFARLLAATPDGFDRAVRKVLAEIRDFRPEKSGSATDLGELVRICLLAQVDALWWGSAPSYQHDADVDDCDELVDLPGACGTGVRFRRQAGGLARRVVRAVERRVAPGRVPDQVGLRFARTRPELAELLDQLSAEYAAFAPPGSPPLWVTSLARSVEHQRRLRSLGYPAMLPSAHCAGYAMDVAMSWYRRYGADAALGQALLGRHEAGQVNVIDGGTTWHVCVSPDGAEDLRRDRSLRIGG